MDRRPPAGEDIVGIGTAVRDQFIVAIAHQAGGRGEDDGQREQRHYFNAFHHAVIVTRTSANFVQGTCSLSAKQ